jgi:hypothetical protein
MKTKTESTQPRRSSPFTQTVPTPDIDEHWLFPLPRQRPRSLFYRSLAEALRSTSTPSTTLRA